MSKIYKPKTLIDGYKLGAKWGDFFLIAIPKQNLSSGVEVIFNNTKRIFNQDSAMIEERNFKDKFGRGEYTLSYFIWSNKE